MNREAIYQATSTPPVAGLIKMSMATLVAKMFFRKVSLILIIAFDCEGLVQGAGR